MSGHRMLTIASLDFPVSDGGALLVTWLNPLGFTSVSLISTGQCLATCVPGKYVVPGRVSFFRKRDSDSTELSLCDSTGHSLLPLPRALEKHDFVLGYILSRSDRCCLALPREYRVKCNLFSCICVCLVSPKRLTCSASLFGSKADLSFVVVVFATM